MFSLGPPDNQLPVRQDNSLIAHYRALFDYYGPGHRAVQWSSVDAQTRRFKVLCEVVESATSVMDVGCGLGALLGFLRVEREFTGRYLGLDFVPEFIEHANRKYIDETHASFQGFDARFEGFPRGYDTILISGVFNNLVTNRRAHLGWIHRTVEQAFSAAGVALAFNGLSTAIDHYERELFYSDPGEMLTWCAERLTRKVTLRHDYNAPPELGVPVDYTIYLYK